MAGAIRDAGGWYRTSITSYRDLDRDTKNYVWSHGKVQTGDAAITNGRFGTLKCKWIIHAVGPDGYGGGLMDMKRDQLRSAIAKVLALAEQYGMQSLAIPAVSTGIFGFPKEDCAQIMISTVTKYAKLCTMIGTLQ